MGGASYPLVGLASGLGVRIAKAADEHGAPNSFALSELCPFPMLAGKAIRQHFDLVADAARPYRIAYVDRRVHVYEAQS